MVATLIRRPPRGDNLSFFTRENINPSAGSQLAAAQVDPTAPQVTGLSVVSNPVLPTQNARYYVQNFDPELYDLADDSHLMRLIRALLGSSGLDGMRRQMLIARLSNLLTQGSFFDLDGFYGALFGLPRHPIELMPNKPDGNPVNPYTDLSDSDLWDLVMSADARYRSRLFLLASAINLGPTYWGLRRVAEAVAGCEVDVVESWTRADFYAQYGGSGLSALTFGGVAALGTYGAITVTYGELEGEQFGEGQTPVGDRGELIFTPRQTVDPVTSYQMYKVLDKLRPSNTMVTIGQARVANVTDVPARDLFSDSERWFVQPRTLQVPNLIQPSDPLYTDAGKMTQARPAMSEYSGEQWTYTPSILSVTSYRLVDNTTVASVDDEIVTYNTGTTHVYAAADGIKDTRQSLAARLSGEGVITTFPFSPARGTT